MKVLSWNRETQHFFENEFPMKNTPSISNHDSISFEDVHEPINNDNFETNVETPVEDNNTVTRKSKRQRVAKFFGEDFII